jgi:hypothetical protein
VVRPNGKLAVTRSVVQCSDSVVMRSPAANVVVIVVMWLEDGTGMVVQFAGAMSPTCKAIQSPLTNKRLGMVVHDAADLLLLLLVVDMFESAW